MLANGVKETTTTTGTGTVTLAAVTGFARFASAFANGERAAYCIQDGNNREWGVGTVGAGNTLERTFRLGTLVGGVYSADPAGGLAAITLASGSAEVICDVHDLLLPELGLEYSRIPPPLTRIAGAYPGVNQVQTAVAYGAGSVGMFNMINVLGIGGSTARNVATTNLFVSALRAGYVSAATAGSANGVVAGALPAHRGSGGGRGGFLFAARFGVSDASLVAGARTFVGLSTIVSAAPPNADMSTRDNSLGLNLDAGDANFNILTRGTTAEKIDLGAAFSRANVGNNANLITMTLWCPPSAAFVGYRVEMLGTNPASATGVLTTNLPGADTMLGPTVYRNNGATAAAVGIDICGLTLVTPQ